MGTSSDYPDVAEWTLKDTGYHIGDMVRYRNNIFRAAYGAGKEPGVDPGWSLIDELYDQAPPAANPAKVIAYIPTWRREEGFNYGNPELYKYITHGIIAFLMFNESGAVEFDAKSLVDTQEILKPTVDAAHPAGTCVSVALGGATDYAFLNLLTAIGDNENHPSLDAAVQLVARFVHANGLDGVDLDLECWWDRTGDASKDQGGRTTEQGPHPAGKALALFAKKLKVAMPGKLVSAAVFATSWYGNNYDPSLADHVDWLGVMSYDLTGSWNVSPVGPHTALFRIRSPEQYIQEQQGEWPRIDRPGQGSESTPQEDNPISSVEDALWYWSNPFYRNWQGSGQKLPRGKLALGVPLYGYDFAFGKDPDDLSHEVPPGYKSIRYKDIIRDFPGAHEAPNANIKVPGSTSRPPFIQAEGQYPFGHNIYLETPFTANIKVNFGRRIGTQGVIIWELTNDVWADGQSIIKTLYANSGNPTTRPALVRYNKCCFLCTHNSYKNGEDGWFLRNQSFDLSHQLDRGVRALMLDVYYKEPGGGDLVHVIPENGVYVLGEVNEAGWIRGSTYVLPALRLRDALNQIGSWLAGAPNEVVTILMEDRFSTAEQIESEIALVEQRYRDMIYNPNLDPSWNLPSGFAWPYLSDLIQQNKRLLLFSSNGAFLSTAKFSWVAYDRQYIKENDFNFSYTDCPLRYNDGPVTYEKLVVFHHYQSIPLGPHASTANRYEVIMDRLEKGCAPTIGPRPNFVAVDRFELPYEYRNAADVVAEINRRFAAIK